MPGTMFTEVVCPRGSSSRKWYTVPLSLIVHAAILALIVVAPLVATGELPMPARLMPSYVIAETVQTNAIENLVEGFGWNGVVVEQPPPVMTALREPVRAGGEIRPPTRIKDALPNYPFIAKANKIEGVVIIEAIIGADGKVENAKIIRSIPLLDQAALDAVKAWEYTPTLLNGRPTPVIMTVTVHFKLSH